MTTKLTLNLDEKIISHAKRIAREQGKSLSKMVEEYFRSIPVKEEKNDSIIDLLDKIIKPEVDKLDLPENMDYKEMVREWRYQDYMKR
jgi:hypothetical protein